MRRQCFIGSKKLEILGKKYGIKTIFVPKYHCQINPIECLWCCLKKNVRTRTDLSFDKMKKLIDDARDDFIRKEIYKKLVRRYFGGHYKGSTYGEVLKFCSEFSLVLEFV